MKRSISRGVHVDLLFWILGGIFMVDCMAENRKVEDCKVLYGTLEVGQGTAVFKANEKVERYDLSGKAYLIASGRDFPGIPGLKEIGFKSDDGRIIEYGVEGKEAAVKGFAANNPGRNATALLYKGIDGSVLEVEIVGKTPVIRIDIHFPGDADTVHFWKRLSLDDIRSLEAAVKRSADGP